MEELRKCLLVALLRHRGGANAGLNAGEVRTYRRGYPKVEFDPEPTTGGPAIHHAAVG